MWISNYPVFSSPDPKDQVRYCHHFVSVVFLLETTVAIVPNLKTHLHVVSIFWIMYVYWNVIKEYESHACFGNEFQQCFGSDFEIFIIISKR